MKFFYFLILILYLSTRIFGKAISIPFKFKSPERRYISYSTSKFLDEYYNNNLILELNIGTPFS